MSDLCDNNDLETLRDYLNSIQTGKVQDSKKLVRLFAPCWEQFSGSDDEGMDESKLYARMESIVWEPPELKFIIERHGGTVLGSTRAALHYWCCNIEAKTACITKRTHRQLRPMQPKLDVKPLADQVAKLILNHEVDERLKWYSDGRVEVLIGKIIPNDSAQQTVIERRRRFRDAVDDIVTTHGWEIVRANVYRHTET